MSIRTAYTTNIDPKQAAAELRAQLSGTSPRFLLYFAAPCYSPEALGEALKAAFDGPALGCSTAGEFAAGKILENSLVAMAFDADHIEDVAVTCVQDTKSETHVRQAYERLLSGFGELNPDDHERTIGLVLHDGMAAAEEVVMGTLSNLSNVPFVGGSAGDDGRLERTHVYVNHAPSTGSAALALLKLRTKYQILKTQSFDVTNSVLAVTEADEGDRKVIAFNGKPAAEEYARVMGVEVDNIFDSFQGHPLGLIVGDEPYVRSPQRVDGSAVRFFSNIKQGTELSLLAARDIVQDTRRDLKVAVDSFGPVAGLINFNCIQRTTELKEKGQADAFAALFEPYNSIGFSTYGESYIGHINQTSIMLLIG